MKKLTSLLLTFLLPLILLGTHNMGGFISYKHLSGNTYEATITTYTKDSAPADRCELEISWGDGQTEKLVRTNGSPSSPNPCTAFGGGPGEPIGNDVRMNIYTGTHTYAQAGRYTLSFEDPNRNSGINNIPNSIQAPFCVQSELFISPPSGANNSVRFSSNPIFRAEIEETFSFNLSANDSDADIHSYELVKPLIAPGISTGTIPDSVSINEKGELVWNTPKQQGLYVFAVKISECRDGVNMGYTILDFQVEIEPSQSNGIFGGLNTWPLDSFGGYGIAINPGDTLSLNLNYADNQATSVGLDFYGESISQGGPTFQTQSSTPNSIQKEFRWITSVGLERCAPYIFSFRGSSDFSTGQFHKDITLMVLVRDSSFEGCGSPCNIKFVRTTEFDQPEFEVITAPNPFTSETHFRLPHSGERLEHQIKLYDLSGTLLLERDFTGNEFVLKRNGLPEGVYLYVISGESGKIASGKLIISD